MIERNKEERKRQMETETDINKDRVTGGQSDKITERQKDRKTVRQKNKR